MGDLNPEQKITLITAIALREATAKQLCNRYDLTREELQIFVDEHRPAIQEISDRAKAKEEASTLDNLWIASKTERIARAQTVADHLYEECLVGIDAAALREFRSYLAYVANELGQFLHRGSGETGSDSLNVDIQGIEWENLR